MNGSELSAVSSYRSISDIFLSVAESPPHYTNSTELDFFSCVRSCIKQCAKEMVSTRTDACNNISKGFLILFSKNKQFQLPILLHEKKGVVKEGTYYCELYRQLLYLYWYRRWYRSFLRLLCRSRFEFNNNNNNNNNIYLTAIGLSPGGSGFKHIYKYLTLCY